jgi:hypothetical protein
VSAVESASCAIVGPSAAVSITNAGPAAVSASVPASAANVARTSAGAPGVVGSASGRAAISRRRIVYSVTGVARVVTIGGRCPGSEHTLGYSLPTARLTQLPQESGMSVIDAPPAVSLEPSFQRNFLVNGSFEGSLDNNTFDRPASILRLSDFGQKLLRERAVAGLQSLISFASDLQPFKLHCEVGGARGAKHPLNAKNELGVVHQRPFAARESAGGTHHRHKVGVNH